jgi:hypothetical protein
MSNSRNEFTNRLPEMPLVSVLDSDATPMAEASSAVGSSSSSAAAGASASSVEVPRYERIRLIPQLSDDLAATNVQSPLFKLDNPLFLYQSSFFDLKTHSALTAVCRRTNPFFSPVMRAAKAAYLFLRGDTVGAKEIVQQNRAILYITVDVKDHRDRRVKGTLLQIARMAGNEDLIKQLRAYLPEDEANRQLAALQVGWEEATAARMQTYVDALQTFLNAIIAAQETTFDKLKIELARNIAAFKCAFVPKPDVVITTGYIFDLQIFLTADQLFQDNINRLGGLWSYKSDLFDVVGFGTLQLNASVWDIQVFKKGIYFIVDKKQPHDGSLNFVTGCPASLSGLGERFVINIYGQQGGWLMNLLGGGRAVDLAGRAYYKNLCEQKQQHGNVMQQPDNHAKSQRDNVAFFNNPAANESSQQALINDSSTSAPFNNNLRGA